MSLNKENINSDLKKGFKFLYLFVRVVSHLGLFGLPIFYSGYDLNNAGEWLLIAQFLMLMISGVVTIIFVTSFFIIFHHIETRYFKGSYRMAYILFKYILPFAKGQVDCFDYELVCQGYEEVVKRGNEYYGMKESEIIENNSFYGYPANQKYIFNLIPSCLPNEKFKFFILTDLIRLIPIIISEESRNVVRQLKAQIHDQTQLEYLINKYFIRTLEYQFYILQDSYLNNLVKQDLAVLFDEDNLDERKRFDLIRQFILGSDNFYFIEKNEVDIEAFNKYIKD